MTATNTVSSANYGIGRPIGRLVRSFNHVDYETSQPEKKRKKFPAMRPQLNLFCVTN